MLQAGEEIRQIRKDETKKYLERNEFGSFNSTQAVDKETELNNNILKKEKKLIKAKTSRWEKLAVDVVEDPGYLYNCNLYLYTSDKSLTLTHHKDEMHFRWVCIWLACSIITAYVAIVSYKNNNIKKIHPS